MSDLESCTQKVESDVESAKEEEGRERNDPELVCEGTQREREKSLTC